MSTSAVETNIAISRRIRSWKDRQAIHMPALFESDVFEGIPDADNSESLDCWEVNLQFPSSLDVEARETFCSEALLKKELKLRKAGAHDSLVELRLLLQKRWWLKNKKKKDVIGTGQKRSKKLNLAIISILERQDKYIERYKRNRRAVLSLSPGDVWLEQYRELQSTDVRTWDDDEDLGEGRR